MKKILFISFIYLYIFLVLGLILHSSAHPQIVGKYTTRYFASLLVLLFLFWPYVQFLKFSSRTSTVKIRKRNLTLSPFVKFEIYLFIFIFLVLLPTELFLRYKYM